MNFRISTQFPCFRVCNSRYHKQKQKFFTIFQFFLPFFIEFIYLWTLVTVVKEVAKVWKDSKDRVCKRARKKLQRFQFCSSTFKVELDYYC